MPRFAPKKSMGRVEDPKGTVKRLLSYFKNYKWILLIVVICIIASSLTNVASSVFIKSLIDDYIEPLIGSTSPDFSGLYTLLVKMAIVFLVGVLTTFLQARLMIIVTQGILKKVRDSMFEKMQSFPISYFDTHTHGDVMSHYTNDTDALREMISESIPQLISSVITIVAVFFAMLYTNVYLTFVVILILVLMLNIVKIIGGKSANFFLKQQESLGKLNGYIEEMINGQKVIKVFNHEEIAKQDFDKLNENWAENSTNANMMANILMPIMGNIGNLQYVLLAVVGGYLAINNLGGITIGGITFGALTIGSIASFLQLSRSFNMPISRVSQQINSISMALAGAERIFKLMDEEPEINNGKVTLVNVEYVEDEIIETDKRTEKWAWKRLEDDGSTTYVPLTGYVEVKDVTFGYVPEKTVLKNVSFYAKPGQKIAFVGATGAGKTTITNLINRFYDVENGQIIYDGIDVKDINKDDLRRSLGMVLQDTNLFTGTIMENIRYGRLDATDEEIIEAAKLANADGFIRRLPDGYQTLLTNNGESLSQGQRQLLSIARAAVADPPVMILDEATSSIDTRTEKIVQDGMDKLMNGRTVFVIAHRLSTVRNSKAIIVLDHGEIIERGEHEALIAEKGTYYQLYTGAFELE
ncbi:MAG: ABC transporter ATP-binding protein [Clostridia bacterium]|nr:ABC transporter ATP-binding protein [Clostridia bacterium]